MSQLIDARLNFAPQIYSELPPAQALETSGIDLSIIVPCYNEEGNIIPTLRSILTAMADIGHTYEIIVIDDCSTDATSAQVEEFCSANPRVPLRLHRNLTNRGFAHNFFDGAFMARGRYFRLICGDDVETVEGIVAVARHMGEKDMVLPYHSDASERSALRAFLSVSFTGLVNLMSGRRIRNYNGCGLFRTFDVMRWHVEATGLGFQAEFVTRMLDLGASYVEVPIVARARRRGELRALTVRNFVSGIYSIVKIGLRRLRRVFVKDAQTLPR